MIDAVSIDRPPRGFLLITDVLLGLDFAVTDDEGRYRIDNVPAGTYAVVAWHESLPSETKSVAVPDGGETDLNFILAKK